MRPLNPDRACIVRLTEYQYRGSENTSKWIEFAYDSTSFEQIDLPDNRKRNLYFYQGGFFRGSGPTIADQYKVRIKKVVDSLWSADAHLTVKINEYGKMKKYDVRINGLYKR